MDEGDAVIRTERLALRAWTEADAGFHRELWSERDPRVPPHRRIDAAGRPTIEELAAWIRRSPDQGPIRTLVVERLGTAEPLGYCGLVTGGDEHPDEPEIAFEFLRRHQGNGYATESGSAIVELARDAGFARLRATVWEWNTASRRVLAKLGFIESGPHRIDPERGRSLMTVLEL
ncbi:GNAT family N-acetyltransferase [Microbacterium sp. NPDC055903]